MRNDPDLVHEAAARRRGDAPVDRTLELDGRRRSVVTEADGLRAEGNEVAGEPFVEV